MDELDENIGDVVETVTAPIADTTHAVAEGIHGALQDLTAAVRINTDTHAGSRDAIGRIEASLADLTNRITSVVTDAAEAAVETVEDVADVAVSAPEAAAEGVEAVVEAPTGAPKQSTRKMLGAMKAKKRR